MYADGVRPERIAVALSLVFIACGKDAKVEQSRNEVQALAGAIRKRTPGSEGTMGPCPALATLDPSLPKTDPWGNAYTLECANGYEVVSAGPDGKIGTKDDIRSGARRDPLPP